MTVSEDLTTQYHQQDTNYYCGAACAQMVLQQCGSGLLGQDGLYQDNHSHSTAESGWYTAPDGLAWTMNNRQSGKYFVLDALSTEDSISRMIAWTVHHYRVSPIAMVFGSAHWVVVRGYTAGRAPTSSGDTGYTITGFDINNPWPPTPSPGPPPPHSSGDACGSGGTRGVADEHVSYSSWCSDYMTGVSGGHWGGKFVAICDPEPPPTRHPEVRELPRPRFDGERLLEPGLAVELSLDGVREAGLLERKNWRLALDGEAGTPVLVQRLDRPDSFYWVVPRTREGHVTSVVSVDARFGTYQQARAVAEPQQDVWLTLDREEITERLRDAWIPLAGEAGRIRLRPELLTLAEHWVWRPCRESLTPFQPFRVAYYGAQRIYVRSDGAVFHRLTTGRGI